jgi:oligopeptide transport system substrate-binding protein
LTTPLPETEICFLRNSSALCEGVDLEMKNFRKIALGFLSLGLSAVLAGCATSAESSGSNRYFGKTAAPSRNVLRYISGSEIETLDPQVSSGQPEARVYMALFDGLVEYDPKTMQPIPAIAERWETSQNVDEFIFYLRKNARWSDGKPITAHDFVYTMRRGFRPDLLSRTAYLGYYIKNAEPYNSGGVFVRKNNQFLLEKDVNGDAAENSKPAEYKIFGPETEFNKTLKSGDRLVLKGSEKDREKQFEKDPKLKAAVEGAEFVPVAAEDLGVEAIDDHTVRITLSQPAPFFVGLLAHQFFRFVPQQAIEKHGRIGWTKPENYVTSGPFKLKSYQPYHQLTVEKDPMYWDAASVKLDGIEFYPLEEQNTMMNLYKAGDVDATYNHTIPSPWIDEMRVFKDEYMDHPEVAIEYHVLNVKKPPLDNLKVRKALSYAVDRVSLAKFRKTVKPLSYFSPEGIFPEYEAAKARVAEQIQKEQGISKEEWEGRNKLNPAKACQLMQEAGYKTTPTEGGRCRVENFPIDKVSILYNTTENNKAVQEFIQAQFKQNLGLTFSLKNMEWKTFLVTRNNLEYDSNARGAWVGDYMDPFAFLSLHYGEKNEGATGWHDPKFDAMCDEANRTPDPQKRYELLARAEFYMLDQQPIIPLVTQATNWIKKPYVKGLYPNPGTLHAWKYVYIERDPAKWDTNVENIMK